MESYLHNVNTSNTLVFGIIGVAEIIEDGRKLPDDK